MKRIEVPCRVILILLALLCIATCFVACQDDPADDPSDDTVSTDEADTGELFDENGYKLDSVPSLDYHTDEVSILCWDSEYAEFETEYGENVIDNAIYERNATVETRLGVILQFEETQGSVKYIGDYKSKVLNAFNAGDYWDIIASYTRSTAICASAGLLKNLGAIEGSYLDFDEPWWSSDIIEKTKVGNTFYFCTGDISTNLVQMTYCTYFNADLLEDAGLESPYELVENNTWTLDKMLSMTQNLYLDKNDNGSMDTSDRIGLVGAYYAWPALLHGCNVPIVDTDETGAFVMNADYKGEKAMDIMSKFATAVSANNAWVNASIAGFTAGNVAFFITESGAGLNKLSDVEFEYGCVPVPKYTAEQESYCSTVRQPITLYGIMTNTPDSRMEEVTATLECLASEGYRQTTPVIFDECMKYLRATSGEMSKMLELIRDTAWFDCARIYAQETKYVCDMPGYALRDGATWESYINGELPTVEAYIKTLSTKLLSVASKS